VKTADVRGVSGNRGNAFLQNTIPDDLNTYQYHRDMSRRRSS
jgi:hypothetical protein